MVIVYVLEQGSYSDQSVVGVYTSAKSAQVAAQEWLNRRSASEQDWNPGSTPTQIDEWRFADPAGPDDRFRDDWNPLGRWSFMHRTDYSADFQITAFECGARARGAEW